MKISIRQPLGYSEIGFKENQEDAVYPAFDQVSDRQRCFVLCDGVGGSEHGEIASQAVSKAIGLYLENKLKSQDCLNENDIDAAVENAYDALDKIAKGHSSNFMATTLACVCIHSNGVLVSHMGDSRIYHVRPGAGILYQSADHSLVNALLQAGELTIEEARVFPRKNVITKAIQPNTDNREHAESFQLTDIRSGDYFFLCCDGVLENLTNERLCEILTMDISDYKKIDIIKAEGANRTKDNYTAYLIPIDKVIGESTLTEKRGIKVDAVSPTDDSDIPQRTVKTITPNKNNSSKGILLLLLFLLIGMVALTLSRRKANNKLDMPVQVEQTQCLKRDIFIDNNHSDTTNFIIHKGDYDK